MIELSNMQFSWKETLILDIEHLIICANEKVFIQGESGSGKSTLLNLLAGVITPQKGEVIINNTHLNTMKSSQRDSFRANHIGFIFQQFNLIPYLNLIENIILPCKFSLSRKEKALEHSKSLEEEAIRLLGNLGINASSILKRRVSELSIGQQQRVAIARALIGSPDMIIADEPTSALDSAHKASFVKMLFDECEKENITLVFVSHDESLKSHFGRCIELSSINSVKAEELE